MNNRTVQERDTEKKLLRKHMRQLRKEKLSEDALLQLSEEVAASVMQTFFQEQPQEKILCTYYSVGAEVPTRSLIKQALSGGVSVWLPRVIAPRNMIFLPYTSNTTMTQGYADIPEPIMFEGAEHLQEEMFASKKEILFLVPGLAFDKYGNRLGYGGGFYDVYLERFLQKGMAHITTLGLAYDFQVIENVPYCDYDKPVSRLMIFSTNQSV